MRTIGCEPVGDSKEWITLEAELWRDYQPGHEAEAENALVAHYLPLVSAIRARLAAKLPDHVDEDDLHSAGMVGLLQAVRHFNPDCGVSFESYAKVRIRGAMLDELRRMDWVPRSVHEKARKLQAALGALEQKLGRAPTDVELAQAMNLSANELDDLRDEARPVTVIRLDAAAPSEDDDEGGLHEVVADANETDTVEQVSQRELKEIVLARLQEMPEIQRKVLALYYAEDLRLRDIAEVFGLTESRICQIHAQAIKSIRSHVQQVEVGLASHSRFTVRPRAGAVLAGAAEHN